MLKLLLLYKIVFEIIFVQSYSGTKISSSEKDWSIQYIVTVRLQKKGSL